MYIKRNIKKRTVSPVVSTTAATAVAPPTIRSSGLGRYRLPTCDEVPAGPYFSEVVNARFKTTSSGKPAIEVMYDIKNGYTYKKIAIGKLPPDTQIDMYHIKQIYPEGTPYYEDFVDSMTEALGLKYGEEFTFEDVKGVTEFVKISYSSNSDLGGIEQRCPMTWDEFMDLCAPNVNQQNYSTNINPNTEDTENIPAPPETSECTDEDNESDDFLEDDDDEYDDFDYLEDDE